jgi:hypothetical protein
MAERLLGRMRPAPGEDEEVAEMKLPPRALNRALLGISSLEGLWIRAFGSMPLGAGVLLFAVKPECGPRS